MTDFMVLLDAPTSADHELQIALLGDDFKSKRYGTFGITRDDVADWKRNLSALPGGRALIDLDHSADRTPRSTEAAGWITDVRLDGDTPKAKVEWTPVGRKAIEEQRYLFFSPTYGEHTNERGETFQNTLLGGALTNRPFLSGMPAITLASDERVSAAASDELTRLLDTQLEDLAPILQLSDDQIALVRQLDISAADRRQAAKDGNALPDGSYPIRNAGELKAAATLAASGHGNVAAAKRLIRKRAGELGVDVKTLPGFGDDGSSDSRRTMSKLTDLLKTLGVDEDPELVTALDSVELDDEQSTKLLDAAATLRTRADTPTAPAEPAKPSSVKTLEQQAADNGKVLLDADEWQQTQTNAALGAKAQKELHQQRFDHAFDAALRDPAGARVTPSERESLQHVYELDADTALKLIADRPAQVKAKPEGEPAIQLDDDHQDPKMLAQQGIHPGSRAAYKKVQAKLKQLDKGQSEYLPVLQQMIENGEL